MIFWYTAGFTMECTIGIICCPQTAEFSVFRRLLKISLLTISTSSDIEATVAGQ